MASRVALQAPSFSYGVLDCYFVVHTFLLIPIHRVYAGEAHFWMSDLIYSDTASFTSAEPYRGRMLQKVDINSVALSFASVRSSPFPTCLVEGYIT
jgi:hypothetical protein